MTRVKKGFVKSRRHKKVLKAAKGYRGSKGSLFRSAKEATLHAGEYAFAGRKARKRDKRSLWIAQINAALKNENVSYSEFFNHLKKADIALNRKILSELANSDPTVFNQIIKKVK